MELYHTPESLELYAVKNQSGKYFRAKGYEGSGNSWVNDIDEAKLYTKILSARRQVTFWASKYPQYGIPVIVVLTATVTDILKEDERVQKLNNAKWNFENAKKRLLQAQKDIEEAKKNFGA
jgi:hypothetical protein